ncbi:hypothetical protein F4553_007362 [Allocatelliglobosispora scoriae]|uniref:Protein kinase domain-containing protein n=1 Tax=Allocatelliglobosispora scoriae TaxID=643052 RepID=A0A841C2E0_9ACTN|nr:serine/threonine-protein kinase [Allocatelliglobosispora scoriae]MBB5873928.1 hypothetical protein [Allocatelliglobosispora scoriae]
MPRVTPLAAHEPRSAGRYRLLGRLGAGGQGIVYLGEDDAGHRVAVKMINMELTGTPQSKRRFAKEIAAAQQVAPFCTAQVLFADLDAEQPYVVSEFIEGHTLYRQVKEHGPLAANSLYRLAVGTATAIAAIHQAGVVHCDFKPDNVILGADGPRVIDFGIARAFGSDSMNTNVMGTVPYMAPERFRNVDVGPQCDVFAWAATMAFAAAAKPPFGNDGLANVMRRVMDDEPDLSGLTGPLRDLAAECLAKDQHRRPSAQQVLLRLLGHGGGLPATLPLETMLQEGTDAATSILPTLPVQAPPVAAPVPSAPPPVVAGPVVAGPVVGSAAVAPVGVPPSSPRGTDQAVVTAVTAPREQRRATIEPPAPPAPPAERAATAVARPPASLGTRLGRQLGDPWGISTAIFVGTLGAATGYIASTVVSTAALVGGATFTIVYAVRAVAAALLDSGEDTTG